MNKPVTPKKIFYIVSIDDDDDFNNYLKILLKKINIRSSITKTPQVFLQKIKDKKPDLCLIDLNLDIASGAGYQLIKAIRNARGKDIPIFVMSRRTTTIDMQMAFDIGADDFIAKPLDDMIFKSKLEKFLKTPKLVDSLPRYSIDENDSECSFHIHFTLLEVYENKFILESSNFIEKGQVFYLEGSIIKEIFNIDTPILFSIVESKRDNDQDHYIYETIFNTDDEQMRYSCRRWLLKNSR